MYGGAWKAAVYGVAEDQTQLSNFTFTFHFHALEKEMATHSSVLAWRIPGTGEPGGLVSMGSHGVKHDWSDAAAAAEICNLWSPIMVSPAQVPRQQGKENTLFRERKEGLGGLLTKKEESSLLLSSSIVGHESAPLLDSQL